MSSPSRSRRVAGGLVTQYLASVIKISLRLISTPIYLSRLGTPGYGLISFVGDSFRYLDLLDLGIGTSTTALVSASSAKKGGVMALRPDLRTACQIQIMISLVALTLSAWFALKIEDLVIGLPPELTSAARAFVLLIGAHYALRLVSNVYKAILIGHQQIAENNVLSTISAVMTTLLGLGLVLAGYGLYGIAIASIAGAAFFFVQCRVRVARLGLTLRPLRPPYSLSAARNVVNLGGWAIVASIGFLLGSTTGRILLGTRSQGGLEAVADFSLLTAAPLLLVAQTSRLSTVVRPGLTQLMASGKESEAAKVALTLIRAGLFAGCVGALGVLFFNRHFVSLWVGPSFVPDLPDNLLIASFVLASSAAFPLRVVLETRLQYRDRAYSFFVGGLVSACIAFVTVEEFGITGVVTGLVLGEVAGIVVVAGPIVFGQLAGAGASLRSVFTPLSSLIILPAWYLVPEPPMMDSWLRFALGCTSLVAVACPIGFLLFGEELKTFFRKLRPTASFEI